MLDKSTNDKDVTLWYFLLITETLKQRLRMFLLCLVFICELLDTVTSIHAKVDGIEVTKYFLNTWICSIVFFL